MSKLYEVINRLDNMAASLEEDNAGSQTPLPVRQEKSRMPLARILLLSGFLVLLGVGCLGVLWWWQSVPQVATGRAVVVQAGSGERLEVNDTTDNSAPAVNSSPLLPDGEIALPSTVFNALASSTLPGTLADVDLTGSIKHKIINIHPIKLIEPVVEPRPFDNSSTVIAEVKENLTTFSVEPAAQVSRWLQQAEALRRNGEWESAAALFARIYARSGSPAVANNLAATLIRLQRYGEAKDVLVEALAKTPDDIDLQKNYQLILQQPEPGRR